MKKIVFQTLGIMLLSLIFVSPVYAKNETVTVDEVTAKASCFSVKGSTNAVAVTIQIRDESDNIVAMETVGTKDGKFSKNLDGSFTTGVNYKVYVADYEGGAWEKKTASVSSNSGSSSSSDSDTNSDDDDSAQDSSGGSTATTQNTGTTTAQTQNSTTAGKTESASAVKDKTNSDKTNSGNTNSDKTNSGNTNSNTDSDKKVDNSADKDVGAKTSTTENIENTKNSDTLQSAASSSDGNVAVTSGLGKTVKVLVWSLIGIAVVVAATGIIVFVAKKKKK